MISDVGPNFPRHISGMESREQGRLNPGLACPKPKAFLGLHIEQQSRPRNRAGGHLHLTEAGAISNIQCVSYGPSTRDAHISC